MRANVTSDRLPPWQLCPTPSKELTMTHDSRVPERRTSQTQTTSTHPQHRQGGNNKRSEDDRLGVLLRRDVAQELLDLIRDVEGDADEDLLDEVVICLHAATPGRLPQIPRGSLVLRVRADERNTLLALIREQPTDDRRAGKVGDRLERLLSNRDR
jgi:hypothetical protein